VPVKDEIFADTPTKCGERLHEYIALDLSGGNGGLAEQRHSHWARCRSHGELCLVLGDPPHGCPRAVNSDKSRSRLEGLPCQATAIIRQHDCFLRTDRTAQYADAHQGKRGRQEQNATTKRRD
jgi:hypothetical protein